MIWIDDVIVHDDVVKEHFMCDLNACKGACCWEGDYGAPLETAELTILENIQEKLAPFLLPEGKKAIAEQGPYVYEKEDKQHATPLVNGGACAYLTYTTEGIAICGIEKAWQAGAVDFRKPVSCHLYPIRIREKNNSPYQYVEYDRWHICNAACTKGDREKMPLYLFVKDALIRKYGEDFFEALDASAKYTS